MLVGGRRSTPRTMSHGFAGGQVPPALLFQVLSPGRWGNPLPLLAGSLLVIALAVAGLVAPTPAIAAVPVQTRPASPTAVLADRMGEAVVVPESVLPPNNETAITKPTVAQLLGLGVGRSPKRDESKTVVPMTSEGWSISLTSTATTVITLTATINQSDYQGNWLYVYNMSYAGGPRRVGYCTWQTTCSMTTIPTESQSTYQAFFGAPSNSFPSPVLATSNTVTPPPWTISLTQSVGPQVTLTATTN